VNAAILVVLVLGSLACACLALLPESSSTAAAHNHAPASAPTGAPGPTPAGRFHAAIRLAGFFRVLGAVRRVAERCRSAFRTEFQFSIAERRRGYLRGLVCAVCRNDAHDDGVMCPRQESADCTACGHRVMLTYYGCPARPNHRLQNVAPTTPAEWARAQHTLLKPLPFAREKPTPG
jgi:hypothetical protein